MQLKLVLPVLAAISLQVLFPAPTTHLEPTQHYSAIKLSKALTVPSLQPVTAMTIQPFSYAPIGTYANAFPRGQCTFGVASMKGNITWSGNANQWADRARVQGKTVSDIPIVGAVAQSSRGGYGHVATVVDIRPGEVEITEMNWDYRGSVRTDWQPTGRYVYIYL